MAAHGAKETTFPPTPTPGDVRRLVIGPLEPAGLATGEAIGTLIARGKIPPLPAPSKATQQPTPALPDGQYIEQRRRVIGAAREHVAALRRLTALRRANEELQNSFLAIERRMPPGANALEQVFADERQSAEARVTLGWGSPGLGQVLPVSSVGVSAISLSFLGIAPRPGAVLRIHLCSLEDQQVIDRWSIPLERLVAGWTMLSLTNPLAGPTRTLDLRLDLDGQADSAVSLHLGDPQRVRLFQVRNAGTETSLLQNGLSMQVWCGEPFGAYATQAHVIVADAKHVSANGLRQIPLSPTLLARAKLVNSDDVKLAFEPVSHVPYRAAIACHPPKRGMTLAAIPLPSRLRPMALAADIEVGNDKSSDVEFAIVLAADVERAQRLLAGSELALEDEAFSGWYVASPTSPAALSASLRRPARQPLLAFAATRMAQPGSNDFAWARFRNISLAAAPG